MEYNINTIKQFPNLSWQFPWINDEELQCIWHILKPYPWRLVGGCVRDSLINKHSYDIDINTPLLPEKILELFKNFNTNAIGKDHGTIMIFLPKYTVEITTLRHDVETHGRKASVEFTDNWEQDSNRRDFTINGLMLDVKTMILWDYHNGLQDLNNEEVKFIGNYSQRIQEDFLRILRYIRFSIRFNKDFFYFLPCLQPFVEGLKQVSLERIIKEIDLMVNDNQWKLAIKAIQFLSIDQLIHSTFNHQWNHWDPKDSLEKWAVILLKNNNNWNNWPINKSYKTILNQSKILLNIEDKITLFKLFNRENHWNIIHIYNLFHNVSYDINILIKFQNFITNDNILYQYNNNKSIIISQYKGTEIHNNLVEYLWTLWVEYL